MSFFDDISRFFGMDRGPEKATRPRKVGNHELPPERLGLREMLPLPNGIREVFMNQNQQPQGQHQGWRPWSPPRPPRERNPLRQLDRDMMDDYLRDGAVNGGPKRGGDDR